AISGAVVDKRDGLAAEILDDKFTCRRTLLRIAGHHAEGSLEALGRVFRRCRHGHLWQALVGIDRGSRDGGPGVEVAKYALHAFIDDLLGNLNCRAGIRLVVTTYQHELRGIAVQLDLLCVRSEEHTSE